MRMVMGILEKLRRKNPLFVNGAKGRLPALGTHECLCRMLAGWKPALRERGLVSGGVQDGGVALVGGDGAVELFEVVGLGDGDAEFLDFDGARVADGVADSFGFAVVAAETVLSIDGGGQFVHYEAGGNFDFEVVGIAARAFKF